MAVLFVATFRLAFFAPLATSATFIIGIICCDVVVGPVIVRTVAFFVAVSLGEAEEVPLHGSVGGAAVGLLFRATLCTTREETLVRTTALLAVGKVGLHVKVLAPVAGVSRLLLVVVDFYPALVQTPTLRHTLEVAVQCAVGVLAIRVLGLAARWLAT